jgi:hypothetical protein
MGGRVSYANAAVADETLAGETCFENFDEFASTVRGLFHAVWQGNTLHILAGRDRNNP